MNLEFQSAESLKFHKHNDNITCLRQWWQPVCAFYICKPLNDGKMKRLTGMILPCILLLAFCIRHEPWVSSSECDPEPCGTMTIKAEELNIPASIEISRICAYIAESINEIDESRLLVSSGLDKASKSFQLTMPATVDDGLLTPFPSLSTGTIGIEPVEAMMTLKPVLFVAMGRTSDDPAATEIPLGTFVYDKCEITTVDGVQERVTISYMALFYCDRSTMIKGGAYYSSRDNLFQMCACAGWNKVLVTLRQRPGYESKSRSTVFSTQGMKWEFIPREGLLN